MKHERARQAGYNLVEVLVAMALLGTVLMSIITLFYFGRRNVYSGKQQTKITAIGTRVMEDLNTMTADDVISNFVIADNAGALTSPCATINGVAYNNCAARATNVTLDNTNDPNNTRRNWKELLGTGTAQFVDPVVTVIIQPHQPRVVANPVTSAQNFRIKAILQWKEGTRSRFSIYEASKLKRPDENLTN